MGCKVTEEMHGWKTIDLEVTSVKMLIPTIGDTRAPL